MTNFIVPKGYKQTEVGVIPKEWDAKPFKCFYRENSRNGIYKTSEFQGKGIRIVNMGEMFAYDFISNQRMNKIQLSQKEQDLFCLADGDLLFGRRSVVPSGAGKCSIIVKPHIALTFESSIIRVRPDQAIACSLYLFYFFASSSGRDNMGQIISGTNIKGIKASDLKNLLIPLPPLAEQKAIAQVLSDTDALIASLDKLIAKKKAIKQGTMQELLTGRRRIGVQCKTQSEKCKVGADGVPEGYKQTEVGVIPEEWEVKALGFTSQMKSGNGITSQQIFESGNYPCYGGNGLRGYTNSHTHDGQYVLIGRQGALCGNVVQVQGKFYASEHAVVVTPSPFADVGYLYYKLGDMRLNQYSESSAQPGLSVSKIKELSIPLPPLAEQKAIAQVLSDMDSEIAELEQRREKSKALKQGLMQVLLTGKVRLG